LGITGGVFISGEAIEIFPRLSSVSFSALVKDGDGAVCKNVVMGLGTVAVFFSGSAIILAASSSFLSSQPEIAQLQTVPYVNLTLFEGLWYEWANMPADPEKNCYCSESIYKVLENGTISISNQCRKGNAGQPWEYFYGFATNENTTSNAQWTCKWSLLDDAQYWVMVLDPNYQFALLGSPSRENAYVLSRQNLFDQDIFDNLNSVATAAGFNNQNWRYPYQGSACMYNSSTETIEW